MKALPTIGQVMSLALQGEKTASQEKQASEPETRYMSEIAQGLREVASIIKSAEPTVSYEDVLNFGRGLLGGQQ
jgi:hypothetical protein